VTGTPVNLNRARKARARARAKARADANAVKFGRGKTAKSLDAARRGQDATRLDQHRRDPE
jgi:hypothetical protein